MKTGRHSDANISSPILARAAWQRCFSTCLQTFEIVVLGALGDDWHVMSTTEEEEGDEEEEVTRGSKLPELCIGQPKTELPKHESEGALGMTVCPGGKNNH